MKRTLVAVAMVMLMAASAQAGYSAAVLADSPIGYWGFNEATGTKLTDLSPNGRDMTYGTNVATWTNGIVGDTTHLGTGDKYANFSPFSHGSTDNSTPLYTAIGATGGTAGTPSPFSSSFGNNFTVEMWVRPTAATAAQATTSRAFSARYWAVGVTEGEARCHVTAGVDFVSSVAMTQDAWSMLTATLTNNGDGTSTANFYINGSFADSVTKTSLGATINPTWEYYGIGHNPSTTGAANTNPFFGDLSELAVYNTVLTSAQIADHYAAAIPEPATMSLLVLGGIATLIRRRNRR